MREPVGEVSYVPHSGAGVQYQSLLAAAFLANATGARLVVPPWLTRQEMGSTLWHPIWVGRSCSKHYHGRRVHPKKQALAKMSEKVLCDAAQCAVAGQAWSRPRESLPTFLRLYDLRGLVATRKRSCDDCWLGAWRSGVRFRLCPQLIQLDVSLVSAEANGHCTRAPSCAATVDTLADVLREATAAARRGSVRRSWW